MKINELLTEGIIDFIKRHTGFAWGKHGDIVRGSVVADYLSNNTMHGQKVLDQFSKHKFTLTDITPQTARNYRGFTDKNAEWFPDTEGTVIDPYKMTRTRQMQLTYDSLVKSPPVLDRDGFVWDGNHRLQRAIELKLPKIPVLIELP